MKRIAGLCLFALLLILNSCTTAGAVIKSNFEGLPVWYYIPQAQVKKGRSVFLGEGKASTQRQAKLQAYANLFDNIKDYFDQELSEEYFRELTVFQTIEDYDLSVSDSDSFLENGVYTVILRATADTELIEKHRSESALMKQKNYEKIKSLSDEAVELMKSGLDLFAAQKYMDAMLLSYSSNSVDSFYSFDEQLKEVIDIINSVNLAIVDENPLTATCKLVSQLKEGKLSSFVPVCPVVASFKAVGVDGILYEDSFSYRTSEQGVIDFTPINYNLIKTGNIVFSLDFEDKIAALENLAGKEKIKELRDLFESKKQVFSYNLNYTNKTVGLALTDFDISGDVLEQSISSDYFAKKFEQSGINVRQVDFDYLLDDKEICRKYSQTVDSDGFIFISRIVETDSFLSQTGKYVVSCEGSFSIFETKTNSLIKSSQIIYSTAFGETEQEAIKNSFENLADLFFSFVRSVYV